MRTTLVIDDDVLQAAPDGARAQQRSLGAVISAWARQSLQQPVEAAWGGHEQSGPTRPQAEARPPSERCSRWEQARERPQHKVAVPPGRPRQRDGAPLLPLPPSALPVTPELIRTLDLDWPS